MHALVCLQGKWSLIMQLSLTFAIFEHPTCGDFYKKSYYLFIYFWDQFQHLGDQKKRLEYFLSNSFSFPETIHQKLRFFFFFGEKVVTLQLSYQFFGSMSLLLYCLKQFGPFSEFFLPINLEFILGCLLHGAKLNFIFGVSYYTLRLKCHFYD